MEWYIEQRLAYLKNRQKALKERVLLNGESSFDYEALRELMETTGRIRELINLHEHLDSW